MSCPSREEMYEAYVEMVGKNKDGPDEVVELPKQMVLFPLDNRVEVITEVEAGDVAEAIGFIVVQEVEDGEA